MTIGQRIKQARKAGNFSLRKLAEEIGVSAMAISKYERDQDVPSSGVLLRLSQALKVKIDFFFRPNAIHVQLQAYRKHTALGIKEQDSIQIRIQDWVERYIEAENLFPEERYTGTLPSCKVNILDEVEETALELHNHWSLGVDPIENLVQVLEDRGIKVGFISGFEDFDACTFKVGDDPVMVTKAELPGDRQRFNLGHELGHLILDIQGELKLEQAANRFAAAFLVPAKTVRFELGVQRKDLNINELYMLKQKYGLSMQGWIYRARDLGIITQNTAVRLFQQFRVNKWHTQEPGDPYSSETSMRMERLIDRALAEDMISISRASELLGKPVQPRWEMEALQQNDLAVHTGY
ncbi:MAG: XRE family transcriptional regulator [Chloroflexi bacterium]|nr:XRE family transcriptional regulator [Chloroflexota bacterium]